jgi:uncharacterized Ntn-hydrolase superfamily protein
MTFSILGRCARTGMFGAAVTTSSICVGARCPWASAGAGAISTQNITDPGLGIRGLTLLHEGLGAGATLERLLAGYRFTEYRQITIIDRTGATAHHSGARTLGTHAVATGPDSIAAGNLLRTTAVPQAMVDRFAATPGEHLAARLLGALAAGVAAGGEMGPVHSAALLVVHEREWPLVDLRVDWDEAAPVGRLAELWRAYEPQMQDYLTRAIDPAAAPAFGVPGDR